MSLFGLLIVTVHPAGPFSACVPPGHCACVKNPPALLVTVNVKRLLGHLQMLAEQSLV